MGALAGNGISGSGGGFPLITDSTAVTRSEVVASTGSVVAIYTPTVPTLLLQYGLYEATYASITGTGVLSGYWYRIMVGPTNSISEHRATWESATNAAYGRMPFSMDIPLSIPVFVPANTAINLYGSNSGNVTVNRLAVYIQTVPVSAVKTSLT